MFNFRFSWNIIDVKSSPYICMSLLLSSSSVLLDSRIKSDATPGLLNEIVLSVSMAFQFPTVFFPIFVG